MSNFIYPCDPALFKVAGVDEVGRGPLVGDVVTAAVILDPARPIIGLNDSKKLSEKKRLALYDEIIDKALAFAIGRCSPAEIDSLNILWATMLAMQRAVAGLSIQPGYVLVDGDEAGKKYAATVRGLLNDDRMLERDHLTALPAMDMEHFMYRQGFDDVYHRVAQLPMNIPMNMRRVITKAIHRSSKPDLAIEVAMEAGRRGVDAIPPLLKKMFSRVLWLARGRAD